METTINMHVDTLSTITAAAVSGNISRSELIMMLTKEMMKHLPDEGRIGKMVQYQERCEPEAWHKFHIEVRMDEYDYLLDLRKFFKMSVSLIIAYAVKKYLNKIMKKINTDNYRFRNYVVIREVVDAIVCWRIYWGYPQNIEQHLPPPATFHQYP